MLAEDLRQAPVGDQVVEVSLRPLVGGNPELRDRFAFRRVLHVRIRCQTSQQSDLVDSWSSTSLLVRRLGAAHVHHVAHVASVRSKWAEPPPP